MYDFITVENKWQDKWEALKIGEVDINNSKPKFFLIWAYLTVSGFHHIGHMRGYSYADAISRYKRMQGYNVLMPAGGHASGNGAVAKSQKVAEKDPKTIEYYKSMGMDDQAIDQLKTPEGFINYFTNIYVNDYKSYGFIGDWRRFTVTTNKDYSKFIEWQFKKLMQKNLLIQKPYYATVCVKCGPVAVDPSEMDLSKGGNAQKNEYTILKMKYSKEPNTFIVVATLRPETVFGQTNIWLDYNIEYVKIKIGNEIWIASKEFANKIKYQKKDTAIVGQISGKDLVGGYVTAPIINKEIIILPSDFCDPNVGTGIVTSVPSDAPADWIGLKDLQDSKELCDKYNLDYETIKKIKPTAIIKSKDFGEFPAIEICKKYNIKSQADIDKLELAKKEVYKKGFHTGIMLDSCDSYAGMKVEQAKDKMKKDMINKNVADIFYDLSEEVICRCGNPVVVEKVDSQWFIKYSDKQLTEKSIEHSKEMLLLPDSYKRNMPNILNWFDDRACARQGRWLGTKFPFDTSYTIEPIADSTLYPIFYLVSLYTNQGLIKTEQLTEEFFDYVYLGVGDSNEVSKNTGISKELIEKIRADVEYWYPLDVNLGGQDHLTVHFPVFLMNHVGILPKKYWPKGIIVNWWVVNKSGKISKSKGGVRSIGDEAKTYSVDAIRLFYANVASPFVNIDFPPEDLRKYKLRIDKIYSFVNTILEKELVEDSLIDIDKWLESRFNTRLKNIIKSMDSFELKEATDDIYFNLYNDIHWYLRRGGKNKILIDIIRKWILLFGLFTPHLSEELNEIIGNKRLVATSMFPKVDETKINDKFELKEKNITETIENIRNVIRMSGKNKILKISLFISENWKYDFYNEFFEKIKNTRNVGQIISYFLEKYPDKKQYLGKTIPRLMKQPITLLYSSQEQEFNDYLSFKNFLEKEYNTTVEIIKAEDTNNKKAEVSSPGKVGILVK